MTKPLDWNALLVQGDEPLKRRQHLYRRLPHAPRCKLCLSPFAGVGGKVLALTGRKPSRKNPNLCTSCFDNLPSGGIEIDIGIVFADVRGSTTIGEQSTATAFADLLNRFYATATDVLIQHDGIVDKLIGDGIMALFIPGVAGREYRRRAALAALALAAAVSDMPIGVGATAGLAFVGNVGSGTVTDFTALGDAVNVAARLQAHASPGEVLLASDLYALVAGEHPGARPELIEVRGRAGSVHAAALTT